MNSTIRRETSTITRHGNTSTSTAHWSRKDNAVCQRRAREHDSCSGIEGASCQAVDTDVALYFPLETGTAKGMLIPMPRSEGRHNPKMVCDPLPSRMKNRGGGTPLGNTSTLSRSTLMVISPYRYNSHFTLRHMSLNLNREKM